MIRWEIVDSSPLTVLFAHGEQVASLEAEGTLSCWPLRHLADALAAHLDCYAPMVERAICEARLAINDPNRPRQGEVA